MTITKVPYVRHKGTQWAGGISLLIVGAISILLTPLTIILLPSFTYLAPAQTVSGWMTEP